MNLFARYNAPEEAEEAFYRAFQDLDLPLMNQVWSESDESVCLHPGGDLLRGKPSVIQSWSDIFDNTHRPSMVHRRLQTIQREDLSIHLVEELIRPGKDPKAKATRIVATNIYRREKGGWRMLSHHASLPIIKPQSSRGRLH